MTGEGPIQAVLFDLDDTLFDHAHATRHALTQVAASQPDLAAWPLDEFVGRHDHILETLHRRVLAGELTVDVARLARFAQLLEAAGVLEARDRAVEVAAIYRPAYEEGWRAVPGALDVLHALAERNVPVVIVTNNGVAEQRLKLARTGMSALIRALVTSEEVGVAKPGGEIFARALDAAGVGAASAVMVGDSWPADIEGARRAGIRAVWFNRTGAAAPDDTIETIDRLAPAGHVVDRLLGRLGGRP